MKIKVKRLNELAMLPTKAHATDAGFDLYATSKTYDNDNNVVYGCGLALGNVKIRRCEIGRRVSGLASQKLVGKAAFGGCKLVSDNAARALKQSEQEALERKATITNQKDDAVVWELSDGELMCIEQLNKNSL